MSTRVEHSLPAQLQRIERARLHRRNSYVFKEAHITLSHGSGGKASHDLIEGLILPLLGNSALGSQDDAAILTVGTGRLAFTTDSYVVSPMFFPGGDIGKLAVHGTVNDLAMSGATALYISLAFIIEEGLETAVFRRILESVAGAAREAGVLIATGDTKVVPRGKADGVFVNTSGVGAIGDAVTLSVRGARPGDRILVSGSVGDHGMAVMLAREALEMEADIESDTAPLTGLVSALLRAAPDTRALKDPTRGGMASSLNEIAQQSRVCLVVDEESVPVRPAVRGACEILGLDPLNIANEGKLVAVVPAEQAEAALEAMRAHPLGTAAALIGTVVPEPEAMVLLRTGIGGSRVLDMLVGDPLPRIC